MKQLQELCIRGGLTFREQEVVDLSTGMEQFCKPMPQIKRLYFDYFIVSERLLRIICESFVHLESLMLHILKMDDPNALRHLEKLPNLRWDRENRFSKQAAAVCAIGHFPVCLRPSGISGAPQCTRNCSFGERFSRSRNRTARGIPTIPIHTNTRSTSSDIGSNSGPCVSAVQPFGLMFGKRMRTEPKGVEQLH
uniref:Uncharacterized protein n=1 Tax=Anopheles melas TaxID=34690 RepID=A0A182TK62_9DIPT